MHRRGPGPFVGPSLGSGTLRAHIGYQRFTERNVEVHGPGVSGTSAARGCQHPADGRAPLTVLLDAFGEAEADGRTDLATEQSELLDRLIGSGAEEFVRPVGGEHDERNPRVVRFEYSGAEIRHGRARGHDHGHRTTGGERQSDREESGGPFVDPHVQT